MVNRGVRCQVSGVRKQMTEAFDCGFWIADCGMEKHRAKGNSVKADQVSGFGCQVSEDRRQKTDARRQRTDDPSSPDGFAAARR